MSSNCGIFRKSAKKDIEEKVVLTASDVDVPEEAKKEKDWDDLTKDEKKKLNKAVKLANGGNKDLKNKSYNRAIKKFKSALKEWQDLPDAYLGLGNAYYKSGDYKNAIESLNSYTKYKPKKAGAYFLKGSSYKKINDQDNALKNFLIVTKLNSKDAKAYIEIGNIYYESEAYKESIKNFKKANGINEKLIEPYLGIGNNYIDLKDYEEAVRILDVGLKIKEDKRLKESHKAARGLLYLIKGRELFNDEKYKEAEKKLIKADTLLSDNYDINYLLGQTYYKLKKNKEAQQYLLTAYKIKKDDVNLLFSLAEINHKEKKYKKAIKYLIEAKEKFPDNYKVYNYLGIIYSETESYMKAALNFTASIKLKKDYAQAHLNKGIALYELEKYEKAKESFKKAYQLDGLDKAEEFKKKADAMIFVNEGNILFEEKKYNQAINKYKKSIELQPDFFGTLVNMGNAYVEINKFVNAIEHYKKALNIEENYLPALVGLERAYRNKGDTVNAKKINKKLEELKGKDPSLYYKLGLSYEANGKFKEAINEYNRALIIDRNYKKAKKRIAVVYYKRGILLFNKKKYNEAKEQFQKAQRYNPSYFDAIDKIEYIDALKYIDEASRSFSKGDYTSAIANYKASLKTHKDLKEVYLNLANSYIATRDLANAEKILKQGIKKFPQFADNYQMMGVIYKNKKKYKTAINYYNKALERGPDSDAILNDIGEIYLREENYNEAFANFSKALSINPNNFNAHINLGIAYYKKGNYKKAIEEFEKTKSMDNYYDPAYFNAGLVYYKLNKYKKSEHNFNFAIRLKKDVPVFYFYLARTQYYMQGKLHIAIKNIEKALSLKKSPPYYYGAGKIYEKRMETAMSAEVSKYLNKAITSYKKVIKMAPNTQLAKWAEDRIFALIPDVRLMRTFPLIAGISGNPDFNKNIIYAGDDHGILYAIDTMSKTGKVIKNKIVFGIPFTSDVRYYKGKIFGGMSNGLFVCIDNKSFKKLWEFNACDSIIGTPVFSKKNVFIGSQDGYIYSLNINTGKLIWKFNSGNSITGNIFKVGDRICFANYDGDVFLMNSKGKLIWKKAVIGNIINSIVINKNKIGVGTDAGIFYILELSSGLIGKRMEMTHPLSGGIGTDGKNFYFGSGSALYAVDRAGIVKWKVMVDSEIKSIPDIRGDLIIFSTENGVVYALNKSTGSQKWKYIWNNPICSKAIIVSKNSTFVSDKNGSILELYYK